MCLTGKTYYKTSVIKRVWYSISRHIPKRNENIMSIKTCVQIYIAVLFIIDQNKNNLNIQQLMDKKKCGIIKEILVSHKKKWISDTCYNTDDLKNIMLSQISQMQRLYFIQNIQKRQTYKDRKQIRAQKGTWRGSKTGLSW